MNILRNMACGIVICVSAGAARGVLTADDFVSMRLIRNPYPDMIAPISREDDTFYRTGGISNAGDIFGDTVWPDDHEHREHFEQAVRWLRSAAYEPEIVNGGLEHVVHSCCGGAPDASAPPKEAYYGIHSGWHRETPNKRHRGVTPEGMAFGVVHSDVSPDWASLLGYAYDIRNDVLTVLSRALPTDLNNQNLLTSAWSSCCGSHSAGYYSKVESLDAPDADPEFEVAAWRPTFGMTDPFPFGINNQNIIVGNVGSIFSDGRAPMKQLPTGKHTWGDPIALENLEEAAGAGGIVLASSSVLDISDNPDRPFGVGVSGVPQAHGVVWDINSGTIVADFGALTETFQISSDGTKVAGVRKQFFPPGETPTIWSTDNGWIDFTELDLTEALAQKLGLEGADIWVELTDIDGVNDSGQVVGIGTYIDNTETEHQGVFLLDTLTLGTVLTGDVNNDGQVNNLDITPFIAALSVNGDADAFLELVAGGSFAAADTNTDTFVNNLDITSFIGLLTAAGSNVTAVPEPSSIVCLALALMMGRRRSKKRCSPIP